MSKIYCPECDEETTQAILDKYDMCYNCEKQMCPECGRAFCGHEDRQEKQMEDKYMEPTKCDWCGKEYEYAEGTTVLGDKLCPDCRDVYELEEF